jgi:hypothetical protein
VLVHHLMKMYGTVEVQVLVFLILAPDGGRWSASYYGPLLSQEDPLLHTGQEVWSTVPWLREIFVSLPGMIPATSWGSLEDVQMVSNGMICMKIGQLLILWGRQDSVAGVLTRIWAGWIGVQFPAGQYIFPFSIVSRLALGPTWSPIHSVPRAVSRVVNWLWCEGNCWAPCSVKVKNEWATLPFLCLYLYWWFSSSQAENMYVCPCLLLVCYTKEKHLHHVRWQIYCETNEA